MTPVLTHRQALGEARRTYDTIYADILGAASDEDRPRLERAYARGVAAFEALTPSDRRLTMNANEAFRTYVEAAATGDPESKLSWLMMMPRVVGEVTAATEPVWAATPMIVRTVNYVLDTSLFVHTASDVTVEYVGAIGTVPVRTWRFVLHARDSRFSWMWTRHEAQQHPDPANKQSTLALAA
jgi:hypothetical protein